MRSKMETVEVNTQLNTRDAFLMRQLLGLGVSVQNHVAYVKTTRAELARTAKVSTKTITRKIQYFGDVGLISFEHKKGAKGGLIIKLNPNKFTFDNLKSPLTDPTVQETKLVNRLFPSYNKPKAIRRTKTEMKEFRDLKKSFTRDIANANDILINDYIGKKDIDWDLFSRTENTEHNYQVWLLSRAYDAMVFTYEKMYVDEYKDPENGHLYGYEKSKHNKGYRSLNGAFFGSYNFKSFERLIDFSNSIKQNPILVMGKVFERYSYTHHMYNKKAKIPVPNQLVDKNGRRIVHEAIVNQKSANKFYGTISTDFKDNPELVLAFTMYENFVKHNEPVSTLSLINNSFGQGPLYHFYTQMIYNVSQELEDDKVRAIDFYMREQVKMMIDKTASTMVVSNTAKLAINLANEKIDSDLLPYAVTQNMGSLTPDEYEEKWVSNAIETILTDSQTMTEPYIVENQRNNLYYTVPEVSDALKQANKYIPIAPSGMLKRTSILEKF